MFYSICKYINLYDRKFYEAIGADLKEIKKTKFKYLGYLELNTISTGIRWDFRVHGLTVGFCSYYFQFKSNNKYSDTLEDLIFVDIVKDGDCDI